MSWPEATLVDAATQVYNNFYIYWLVGESVERVTTFTNQLLGKIVMNEVFPLTDANGQPVRNLIAMLSSYMEGLTETNPQRLPLDEFEQMIKHVYGICTLVNQLRLDAQISVGQSTAVLTAYNNSITP